jgi:hypothetical protein
MVSTLSMPIITQAAPLTVADFNGLPYSPALLLDSKFDAAITDAVAFHEACQGGFEAYFDAMYDWDVEQGRAVFVAERYTWEEVIERVVDNALSEDEFHCLLPCAERVGFTLGWLSALAFTEPAMAGQALVVLEALLVPSAKKMRRNLVDSPGSIVRRVCPRKVDSAGWPLDM